jgi:hypothetical protein
MRKRQQQASEQPGDRERPSSRLAATSVCWSDRPVTLPRGRARLATRPVPTGSPAAAKTMGMTDVACLVATTTAVPDVTMTSTLRWTNSAAISAKPRVVLSRSSIAGRRVAASDPTKFAQPLQKSDDPLALDCRRGRAQVPDGRQLARLLRARRERPRCRRAAEQRDELAASIKKTRSHGTIAKRVGLAKRPKPAKGLPFSSSRVGRQRPVRNSFDHLVGAGE